MSTKTYLFCGEIKKKKKIFLFWLKKKKSYLELSGVHTGLGLPGKCVVFFFVCFFIGIICLTLATITSFPRFKHNCPCPLLRRAYYSLSV